MFLGQPTYLGAKAKGENSMSEKAATAPKRCKAGSARPARYGESLIA